jgi:hypothetical protein
MNPRPSTRLRDIADDVVQHITVAEYALAAGDAVTAQAALDRALALAREVATALIAADHGDKAGPGDLIRPA